MFRSSFPQGLSDSVLSLQKFPSLQIKWSITHSLNNRDGSYWPRKANPLNHTVKHKFENYIGIKVMLG